MEVFVAYKDLCGEIEILELRIWSLQKEFIHLRKKMMQGPSENLIANYSGMPGSGQVHIPLDKQYARIQEIEEDMTELNAFLTVKKVAKAQMEQRMSEFEGLEYKVAYKRDIEGKHLDQIADELGYSYDWIRKISSRVKRVQIDTAKIR